MLYQKLLMGRNPFFISVGKNAAFEIHRHPEIELSYCIEGAYDIVCENKQYQLKAGDFALIPPMAAHEFPTGTDGQRMTIEVGFAFLGEFFKDFTSNCHIYKKSDLQESPKYNELISLLNETAKISNSDLAFGELIIKGNLYKISALLLQTSANENAREAQNKKSADIKSIDLALEKIALSYHEPLTIEDISGMCGYSKSNFCKIFKSITGDTFHNLLNRHRVEVACMLLGETDRTIEKVAQETGFSDTKSFCRVFKKIMGKSAGKYRKDLCGFVAGSPKKEI